MKTVSPEDRAISSRDAKIGREATPVALIGASRYGVARALLETSTEGPGVWGYS